MNESHRAHRSYRSWPFLALERLLLIERADCLGQGHESLTRNRLTTEVRESVRALLDLFQRTVDPRKAVESANDANAFEFEQREFLGLVFGLVRPSGDFALYAGFVILLATRGGQK